MITVKRFPTGWRLVDGKGRLHSAAIKDKARAQAQADHMNTQVARIRDGFRH